LQNEELAVDFRSTSETNNRNFDVLLTSLKPVGEAQAVFWANRLFVIIFHHLLSSSASLFASFSLFFFDSQISPSAAGGIQFETGLCVGVFAGPSTSIEARNSSL